MSSSTQFNNPPKRMVPLRYVLMPIAIVLAAIIILVIIGALAPKPTKKPVDIKAPLVEVLNIIRQDIDFTVASQGSVSPRTETGIITEVTGMIVKVSDKFNVGGYFKKGELLLEIDDITYQVALLRSQSRLDSAEALLVEEKARAKQAEDEWLLTRKPLKDAPILALRLPQLQKAQADLKAAKADLKEAQIKLARTKITAPYDAMIKEKNVDIGQYVSIGTTLGKIFAIDYAEVRLPIKQKDVPFLTLPKIYKNENEYSKVELYYSVAGKKNSWVSHITRYEGVVDVTSRVQYVIAQIDDPYNLKAEPNKQEIGIGTFVNASISGKTLQNVIAIPRAAIYGGDTLYLVDSKNKLHIQSIKLLRTDVNTVYTKDNINNNLRLITTRLEIPVEGMSLRIEGEQLPETTVADDANTVKADKEQGEG